MSPHANLATYDTWLQKRPGSTEVHCGGPHPIAARTQAERAPNEWTPERLLLAAIELATCRQFIAAAEQAGVSVTAYESSALARVRIDEAGPTLLDVTVSLLVGVASPDDVARAERLLETLEAEPLMGIRLEVPRQLRWAVQVLRDHGERRNTAPGEARPVRLSLDAAAGI